MTEQEWLSCTDPDEMLTFLGTMGKASERKLRLFAVACCRRVWHLLADERSRKAVEASELYGDGDATDLERMEARFEVLGSVNNEPKAVLFATEAVVEAANTDDLRSADDAAKHAARAAAWQTADQNPAWTAALEKELTAQAALLRDVFGNPFCTRPALDAAWLAWNDGTIKRLAEATYEERSLPSGHLDQVRLTVLADALEDAGADAVLLEHLRLQGGIHVRGCWVLDLLLGFA